MGPDELRRRYVRQPKPESKIKTVVSSFFAYDQSGAYKGLVKLTPTRKQQYEAMGFTFKRRNGVMPPDWKEAEGFV
ncbi:hypothetical protein [Streptomyces roseolus]|uniref:hypothetical protein n=1 Tax=Streptomyces roseolus TaxID=67358 RepID=UPI00167920C0|nr:hypothetical protein [Streptomyces roseolus]GGR51569.1 hypothetical protein GCM10010282_50610 [Streptomyces roseolus]